MGKWTKAAKAVKAKLDEREARASDMDIVLNKIARLPPGQLKKLLDDEFLAVLSKYGIVLE